MPSASLPATVGRGPGAAVLGAWVAAALAIGLTVLAAVLLGDVRPAEVPWKQLLTTAAWSVPGALIAAGRPRIAVGWLMLAVALLFAGAGLSHAWVADVSAADPVVAAAWAVWFADRFAALVVPCALVALVLVPDGRLPAPWWRPVLAAVVAVQLLVVVTFVLAEGPAAGPGSSFDPALRDLDNPVGVLPRALGEAVLGLDALVLQAPLLLLPLAVVTRLRRASPSERRRLAAVLLAVAVFALLVVLGHALLPVLADALDIAGSILLGAVLVAAVLRRRLAEVQVVLHHTTVYVTLTALIGCAYLGVTALAARWGAQLPPSGAGVAAGAIALALLPVRSRLQRVVDRLLHGHRSDPYAAVERLARTAHGAPAVEAVLTEVARSVATSLVVPWVRVTAGDLVAEVGDPSPAGRRVGAPLRSGPTVLGTVEVHAGVGRRLSADDVRLLHTLGAHGGIAVHAATLAETVQAGRIRTVVAREEERRRVGRDLHDGLGPTLAALTMQLAAVRRLVRTDPALAEDRLAVLERAAEEALSDVRRVARELRSPALEQLGLVEALRQTARQLGVELVVAGQSVPALTPALESAAYRIGTEALTNVARHTTTRVARLRVEADDGALTLCVADEGPGVGGWPASAGGSAAAPDAGPPALGVGIPGMRERAAELGGTVSVGRAPGGGTAVVARLPLPAPTGSGVVAGAS